MKKNRFPEIIPRLAVFAVVLLFISMTETAIAIEVGVKVELQSTINAHWTHQERVGVNEDLADSVAKAFADKHLHWDFVGGRDSSTAVWLSAEPGSVPNEIVLTIELRRDRPSDNQGNARPPEITELAQAVLYKPGDFVISGRPSSSGAQTKIALLARHLVKQQHESIVPVLLKKIPIAKDPSSFDLSDRSLVLPLPKSRFEHLALSKFKLRCAKDGQKRPVPVTSVAEDKWKPFGTHIPTALTAKVVDQMASSELEKLTPRLVFLLEHVPLEDEFLSF